MNKIEIALLKTAAVDVFTEIQKLRRQRTEIDQLSAAAFRKARSRGVDRNVIKQVLVELPADASEEAVWAAYAGKINITAEAVADEPNALDEILGAQ